MKSVPTLNLITNEVTRKVNGVKFPFTFNEYSRYRSMYFGLDSKIVVKTLLRYLKKGSTFLDVGANIGYISAIGLGCVGRNGQVHSFEPVPTYYEKLLYMTKLNKKYNNIFVNNFALGETYETMNIAVNRYIWGWNTLVPELMKSSEIKTNFEVNIKRLDDYILQNNLKNISLIKIDVEGFEIPVLQGLKSYFEEEKLLPNLLIEVSPSAYKMLGYKLSDLENILEEFSYRAYNPNNNKRFDLQHISHWDDVLFVQKRT
ncbi:MAG: FkbM family methyltransferase [Promethearchaeota archaeon]